MFPGIDTIRGILEKQGQAVHRNRAPESSLSHDLADGTSARIDDQDQPSELRPKSLSMFNEFGYVRYKADAKRPLGMKGDT